jgi:ABC-type proline/glycine betaine transport system substrate-binding protein
MVPMKARRLVCALFAAAVMALAVFPARAADDTTGTVTIETMSIATGLGFGYSWGTGV